MIYGTTVNMKVAVVEGTHGVDGDSKNEGK